MPKEIKLSEVFHKAADEHLYACKCWHPTLSEYSCVAVKYASHTLSNIPTIAFYSTVPRDWSADEKKQNPLFYKALIFMREMGCPTGSQRAFKQSTKDIQDVRYAWLKLLAQIAEEEGI